MFCHFNAVMLLNLCIEFAESVPSSGQPSYIRSQWAGNTHIRYQTRPCDVARRFAIDHPSPHLMLHCQPKSALHTTYTFECNLTSHVNSLVFCCSVFVNRHLPLAMSSPPAPTAEPTSTREAIARAIAERAPTNPRESLDEAQYALDRERRVYFRRLVDPGIARGAQPTHYEATLQVCCNSISHCLSE
jgi:hypothetical protein